MKLLNRKDKDDGDKTKKKGSPVRPEDVTEDDALDFLTAPTPDDTTTDPDDSEEVLDAETRKEKFKRETKVAMSHFRVARTLIFLAVFALLVALLTWLPYQKADSATSHVDAVAEEQAAHQAAQDATIQDFTHRCVGTTNCPSFNFEAGREALYDYAQACFNVAEAHPEDQAGRLKYTGGPPDCGWNQIGSGNATISYDSTLDQGLKDAKGTPRADIAIVGVKIHVIGQYDAVRYAAVVQAVPDAPYKVLSVGSIFTTTPNLLVNTCTVDAVGDTTPIQPRIEAIRAGQLGQQHVDLADILKPGLTMAPFGPSITAVKTVTISLCRPTDPDKDPNKVIAETTELFSGPIPGAGYTLTTMWSLERTSPETNFLVDGWGFKIPAQ